MSLPRSVYLASLGCAKNLVDSEVMLGGLRRLGIEPASAPDAEMILVNTCGFIASAKAESVDTILSLARHKQGACRLLLVSGCLSQLYRKEIARELPEVDAFLGPDDCGRIADIVRETWGRVKAETPFQYVPPVGRPTYLYQADSPREQLTPRHYAYVKISEGCDNPCRFCIIPRLRGPFRSRSMESIEREVQNLVASGVREIVLIAQDLTDYGVDIYGVRNLDKLLQRLNAIEGLRWIRLMYTYPAHFSDAMVDALALPKVCNYVDMPVQHLTDPMLLGMGRRLGKEGTMALISRIRARVPGIAIRTSLIVGMPGETDALFEEMLEAMQDIRFEHLGVFTYSREDKTAAGLMKGHVSESVKRKRRAAAMAAQQKISWQRNAGLVGRTLELLVDSQTGPGQYAARTQWDAPGIDNRVLLRGHDLAAGSFQQARVVRARPYDLEAEHATLSFRRFGGASELTASVSREGMAVPAGSR